MPNGYCDSHSEKNMLKIEQKGHSEFKCLCSDIFKWHGRINLRERFLTF